MGVKFKYRVYALNKDKNQVAVWGGEKRSDLRQKASSYKNDKVYQTEKVVVQKFNGKRYVPYKLRF